MPDNAAFSREKLAGYEPERMAASVALVVGVGALGQNVAQNLALSGIGELRLVDKDQFEDHNRTRSPAYPFPEEQSRYGLGKARVVANKLIRMTTANNARIRYADAWIQELGDGAFKDVSVLVSCVDSPAARAYLADKARLHGIPFAEGGFEGPNITLSCYPSVAPEEALTAPCWRCSHQESIGAFSCRFYAMQAEKAGFIPAIQNAAAALGGLQSEAAILATHGQMPLAFCALDVNIRTGRTRLIHLATDPHCPGAHSSLRDQPIRKLTSSAQQTLKALLVELESLLGPGPIVTLPSPFIWTAPCTQTGKLSRVQSPDWLWMMNPRSTEAGGPYTIISDDTVNVSPEIYLDVSAQYTPAILKSTCKQAGFAALSVVPAWNEATKKTSYFSLAGDIDDLFENVTNENTTTI